MVFIMIGELAIDFYSMLMQAKSFPSVQSMNIISPSSTPSLTKMVVEEKKKVADVFWIEIVILMYCTVPAFSILVSKNTGHG